MIGAEHSPGVETTTGSLAQAISQAGGLALARRRKGEPGRVWVMMSDGEFQEGQVWEAISTAAFHHLDNLRVVVDVNGQQCDGCVDDVGKLEPLADRIVAFGGSVDEPDGHDLDALDAAMQRETGKPHFVLARTDPAHGLPLLGERAPFLHYLRFTSPEERAAYQNALERLVD
jgi:transketolase